MAFQLKITEKVLASLVFTDAKGRVTTIDGVPNWSVSPDGVVALQVAPDGLSATVIAQAILGTASIVVDAGAKHLAVSAEVQVVEVPDDTSAVAGTINFGAPEPK